MIFPKKNLSGAAPADFAPGYWSWAGIVQWLRNATRRDHRQKLSLIQIKLKMESSLRDLEGSDADRQRQKILAARHVQDLWQMRSEVHQMIARHIGQQIASDRINALLPCFAGWIPKHFLVKI
jgi:hypothetical protein